MEEGQSFRNGIEGDYKMAARGRKQKVSLL
jgi:hypothetical protein